MIAHVSSAAAVGRKLTMAEAWAATRGKRWRLLGMAFLLGLGVLAVVGFAVGLVVARGVRLPGASRRGRAVRGPVGARSCSSATSGSGCGCAPSPCRP